MQFKKNKTIEMQCGHINQVGRIDLHELIQSANNKGLFVNVSITRKLSYRKADRAMRPIYAVSYTHLTLPTKRIV